MKKYPCLYCDDDIDHIQGCPQFQKDLKIQRKWQVDQGNDCTICYNNNWQTRCSACGYWGYVKLDGN